MLDFSFLSQKENSILSKSFFKHEKNITEYKNKRKSDVLKWFLYALVSFIFMFSLWYVTILEYGTLFQLILISWIFSIFFFVLLTWASLQNKKVPVEIVNSFMESMFDNSSIVQIDDIIKQGQKYKILDSWNHSIHTSTYNDINLDKKFWYQYLHWNLKLMIWRVFMYSNVQSRRYLFPLEDCLFVKILLSKNLFNSYDWWMKIYANKHHFIVQLIRFPLLALFSYVTYISIIELDLLLFLLAASIIMSCLHIFTIYEMFNRGVLIKNKYDLLIFWSDKNIILEKKYLNEINRFINNNKYSLYIDGKNIFIKKDFRWDLVFLKKTMNMVYNLYLGFSFDKYMKKYIEDELVIYLEMKKISWFMKSIDI